MSTATIDKLTSKKAIYYSAICSYETACKALNKACKSNKEAIKKVGWIAWDRARVNLKKARRAYERLEKKGRS